MDSRQLAHFCAVVREGSFTKAADLRHVSQSALSQQVKALEAELGVTLLERHGRTFTPTAAGELLAAKGEGILVQLSDLEAEVIDVGSGRPRRLAVGYLNRYEGWEVAGNRGWMPVESRAQEGRTGTVIRRIPLHDGAGQSMSEYYAFWPKTRTNPLVEEFADILEGLFWN